MPRRSRPSYRLPPSKEKKELEKTPSKPKNRFVETEIDSIDNSGTQLDEDADEDFEQGSSKWSKDGELEDSDDEEIDADAPRVAVWEEDNGDFLVQKDDDDENEISDEVRVPALAFSAISRSFL
jgi:ribosomal RNA-processing protein 36